MKNTNSAPALSFQKLAFLLLVAGFGFYVASDTGLIDKIKLPQFGKLNESAGVDSESEKSQQVSKELEDLEQQTAAKRRELKGLMSQFDQLAKDVGNQKKRLEKVKGEIKTAKSANTKKSRPGRAVAEAAPDAEVFEFASWNEFVDGINNKTNKETEVQTLEQDGLQFLRLTNERLFGRGSIYLRPVGIQMTKMLAGSLKSFKNTKIFIRADESDPVTEKRAEVLKKYLEELTNHSQVIEIKKVVSTELMPKARQGIEVWVGLGEQGT